MLALVGVDDAVEVVLGTLVLLALLSLFALLVLDAIKWIGGKIPVVGHYIVSAAESASHALFDHWANWLDARVQTANQVLQIVATDLFALGHSTRLFAQGVYTSMAHFVNVELFGHTGAITTIYREHAQLHDDLYAPRTGDIPQLQARADAFHHELYDADAYPDTRLDRRITQLHEETSDAIRSEHEHADNRTNALREQLYQPVIGDIPYIATKAENALEGVLQLGAETQATFAQLETGVVQLAPVAALATVVTRLATETGLDNEECRSKVRQICAADAAGWGNLLALAGFAAGWVGLRTFVELAQDFARETVPPIVELLRGD